MRVQINNSLNLSQFKKNPSKYTDKFIRLENMYVFQVMSFQIGDNAHELIGMYPDNDPNTVYWTISCGETSILEENYLETVYVLPVAYDAYKVLAGESRMAVFSIMAKNYNVEEGKKVFVFKQANVRSGPGLSHSIIGVASSGMTFVCLEEVYDWNNNLTWYKKRTQNGLYGYISSSTAYYK